MHKPSLLLLVIVASLLIGILLDFVFEPSINLAILYVVPVAIAGRYSSPRTVIITGVVATTLMVLGLDEEATPVLDWPYFIVTMGVIIYLAAQSAEWRYREGRRAQEAETAREQLREFMGLVVHDLRGPLTVAIGYTQMALRQVREAGGETTPHPLTKAETALRTMRRLVEDLLDSTRIGSGRFAIHPAPVDFTELTRSVVEEQQQTSADSRVVLDAPTQITLDCDAERLRQVLTNLLSNAIKFSPASTEVRVSLCLTDGTVRLSVSDRGVGIAPNLIPELFKPFSRLGREGQATGTGLGLYITKGIVEAHGGRIWVESTPGIGSTFFVLLPHRSASTRTGDTTANN